LLILEEQTMAHDLLVSRYELRAAIKKRGHRKYDVWTGFAPKGNFYFSLDGTPNCLHLIWMEGDPEIESYTIPTQIAVGEGIEGPAGTMPDAICVLRSGAIEWREVKTHDDGDKLKYKHSDQVLAQTRLAEKMGVTWRLVTTADLNKQALLIRNWRQGLAYIWAAQHFDLAPYESDIRCVLESDRSSILQQVLDAYTPENESLLIAATFRLVQKGEITSDLAKKPFGLDTALLLSSEQRGAK
jgi:hypothetical protein